MRINRIAATEVREQIKEISKMMGEPFERTRDLVQELMDEGIIMIRQEDTGSRIGLTPDVRNAVKRYMESDAS
tara:strand:+ start:602 stop:820 length:219 start_codon:yes stop_codon:yes gene_type:complete